MANISAPTKSEMVFFSVSAAAFFALICMVTPAKTEQSRQPDPVPLMAAPVASKTIPAAKPVEPQRPVAVVLDEPTVVAPTPKSEPAPVVNQDVPAKTPLVSPPVEKFTSSGTFNAGAISGGHSPSSASGPKTVQVSGYTTKNGVHVGSYARSSGHR